MGDVLIPAECEEYGREIDRLTIARDYGGLKTLLVELEKFSAEHDTPEYAPIFYYLGTGNGILSDYYRRIEGATGSQKPEIINYQRLSLYYFRKALDFSEQYGYNQALLFCIYTNYANQLDSCGRVIEALRIYRKAIVLNSTFSMAMGNYGRALKFYANMVNDSGHYNDLHCFAYQAMKKAIEIRDPNLHEEAIAYFEKILSEYEELSPKEYLNRPITFKDYDLGEIEEKEYREWCLRKHLFLNPMNDLLNRENAFAHDPLTITTYTEHVDYNGTEARSNGNPPKWFSMLNQLKEEYIYARFLCYEGSEKAGELHYADKEVKLSLSSFEYVNYSIRTIEICI